MMVCGEKSRTSVFVLSGTAARNTMVTSALYLARKDPAQANDDQDVEDGRSHDRANPDVSFSDEDAWGRVSQREEEEKVSRYCFKSSFSLESGQIESLQPVICWYTHTISHF